MSTGRRTKPVVGDSQTVGPRRDPAPFWRPTPEWGRQGWKKIEIPHDTEKAEEKTNE